MRDEFIAKTILKWDPDEIFLVCAYEFITIMPVNQSDDGQINRLAKPVYYNNDNKKYD